MAAGSKQQNAATPPASDGPSNKPLQIFLLVALVISGASYVADEWNRVFAPRRVAPDRRLVESRSEYASHMQDGLAALRRSQYESALAQFRLAQQAQNSAESHYNMAATLLKLSRPDEAVAQFKEAVRLNPHYTEVYLAWGQSFMTEGRPEEAAAVFRDALRVSPNSSLAQFGIGQALASEEKTAVADQRAATSQGRTADAVAFAAKVDRLRSDALQHMGQAQRLGLDRPDFWLSYGQLLGEAHKFPDAETVLRLAVSNKPDLADAHFALAVAQCNLQRDIDAIPHFEASLALHPDDPATLERLALLYATTTNTDLRSPKMAVQLATRANDATSSQNPRFMDTLARSYAADGDFLQAMNWEGQAIHRAEQIHDVGLLQELRPRYDLFVQHKTS